MLEDFVNSGKTLTAVLLSYMDLFNLLCTSHWKHLLLRKTIYVERQNWYRYPETYVRFKMFDDQLNLNCIVETTANLDRFVPIIFVHFLFPLDLDPASFILGCLFKTYSIHCFSQEQNVSNTYMIFRTSWKTLHLNLYRKFCQLSFRGKRGNLMNERKLQIDLRHYSIRFEVTS